MEFVKMKSIAAYRQLHIHSRRIVASLCLFTGFLFLVLVFSSAVIIKTAGNSNLLAAGGSTATVDWSSSIANFRYTVCLAGTSQCQTTYKTTTSNSGSWTLASLVNYDLHVDISPGGGNWYGWENQTNVGINCYGPATCSKSFSWARVDYHVTTNLDGNTDHIVTQPGTSYAYTNVPANTSYSGTVQFKDFDNLGNPHTVKNVSGTSGADTTPGCTLNVSTVTAGGVVNVKSVNSLNGTIRLVGGYGTPNYPNLNTLTANGTVPITVPSIAASGLYVVHVGSSDVACIPNLTVTAAAGFSFTLGNPTVSGTTATFSITPAAGASSILYIKDLVTSIPIPAGATSISWTGAAGTHQAVISAYGVDVSNTVSFSITTVITGSTAAKLLIPTTQCVNGVVTAHFSWTAAVPPTGTTFDIQRMDLSDGSSMAPGTYYMLPLMPTATARDFSSVPADVMLYWRIESHVANTGVPGTVLVSSTGSVMTTSCGVTMSSAGTPAKLVTPASGTCMSDGRDQLIFSWTRAVPPTGYAIDGQTIGGSTTATGPFYPGNLAINVTSTTRTQTLTNGVGQNIYWVINTHFTNGITLTSAIGTMVAPPCVVVPPPPPPPPPPPARPPFSADAMMTALKSQTGSIAYNVPRYCTATELAAGLTTPCNVLPADLYGKILYGLAGSESSWTEVPAIPGYCVSGPCQGLFQYDPVTWFSHAARATAVTGKTYNVWSGWDQLEVVLIVLGQDGCPLPPDPQGSGCGGTLWQQWKADFNGSARQWNMFTGLY